MFYIILEQCIFKTAVYSERGHRPNVCNRQFNIDWYAIFYWHIHNDSWRKQDKAKIGHSWAWRKHFVFWLKWLKGRFKGTCPLSDITAYTMVSSPSPTQWCHHQNLAEDELNGTSTSKIQTGGQLGSREHKWITYWQDTHVLLFHLVSTTVSGTIGLSFQCP